MGHSLEVRVPLVDHVLLKRLSALVLDATANYGKYWLSASPRPPLPDKIWLRPKTGFLTPIQSWIKADDAQSLDVRNRSPLGAHWSRRWALNVAQRCDNNLARAIAA
jgi:asparagine synthase (glutamine-hydrolysing)